MSLHTLMFGWEYPPKHLGGLGVACKGLVEGLSAHGVDITLVLPHAVDVHDANIRILSASNIPESIATSTTLFSGYHSCESYERQIKSLPQEARAIYGHDLGDAIEHYTASAVMLTKNIDADVVHCHDWMTYEAGHRAARHHRKPLVAHIHATELDRTHFQPNEWIFKQERVGLRNADKIIAVSNYTKNMLTTHYGIAADKIHVVHNGNSKEHGMHHKLHKVQKHVPMVLFLGRLTIQKGPWQFLEMAKKVHAQKPHVQFVMAGDGDMLEELIDRTCDLGLSTNVIFAGNVQSSEARRLYAQADCFVMPSVSEPFGLVALEAIAQGTPLVLSRQSGAAEVIDHAFKVDFWDTEKMADCVLTVLREQPLAQQLRSEAPRVLQKLTWQNQAGSVRSVYEHLLHTHA